MELKEKVKGLPSSPGVYLMKDSLETIIYVGKSKNLKSRVGSYFVKSKSHSPKVVKLVQNLKDFDYILTDTEFEAFLLECKLIQEIKPRYNSMMKSPSSYPYICIAIEEDYPTMEVINYRSQDSNVLYFGPYTNKNIVERAVQGIKECCKLLCNNPTRKDSGCLNYALGLCIGLCQGKVSSQQYKDIFLRITSLLSGTDEGILNEMKENMLLASEKFDFETAAKYRDYISSVNSLINKEKVIDFTEKNNNIVLLEKLDQDIIKVFFIKGNKALCNEKYKLTIENIEDVKEQIRNAILNCFSPSSTPSSFAINKDEIDQSQIIYSYLKENKSYYMIITEEWLQVDKVTLLDNEIRKLILSLG